MSDESEFEDKVDDLVEEIAASIAEHTDETVIDDDYMMQQIRSLAEDAVQQFFGTPEGEEGDDGIVYYPNMDDFSDEYED